MSDIGFFKLELETNTLDCDPQNPAFVQNPYELYGQLHKNSPCFFWKQYGHWCFAGWDQVNALLRDRRFGRQILHKMSRDELGWPEPLEHTKDFDLSEKHSLLALEPPAHTRLRLLVNRAFISRQIEQLRPQVERLANWSIDRFESKKQIDFIKEFATPIPILIITQMLDIPSEMGQQLLDWSHKIVAMYMFGRSREDEIT
ncbi:Putative cytochrome P450 hydroxylase, partial [hydrothermal vent metagenome]